MRFPIHPITIAAVMAIATPAVAAKSEWKKVRVIADAAAVADCRWVATVKNGKSSDHSLKAARKALRKKAAKAAADTVLITRMTTGQIGGVGGVAQGLVSFTAADIDVRGDAYRCANAD